MKYEVKNHHTLNPLKTAVYLQPSLEPHIQHPFPFLLCTCMFLSLSVVNNLKMQSGKKSPFATLARGSSKYELRAPGFPGYCGALANSRVSVKLTRP